MGVDVRSEKLTRLVDENVEVERLGTGFTFTEGPVWHLATSTSFSATCPPTSGASGRLTATSSRS